MADSSQQNIPDVTAGRKSPYGGDQPYPYRSGLVRTAMELVYQPYL
jgi:hypothetical protein